MKDIGGNKDVDENDIKYTNKTNTLKTTLSTLKTLTNSMYFIYASGLNQRWQKVLCVI